MKGGVKSESSEGKGKEEGGGGGGLGGETVGER